MNILKFLSDQLHNQIIGGGLVLMVSGSLIALARKVPERLGQWVKRRVTAEVEILSSDPLFDYVTLWLHEQPYSKRSRRLTATTATRIGNGDDDNEDAPPARLAAKTRKKLRVFLSPAPGAHVFLYRGRILWLHRNRDQTATTSGASWASVSLKHETYTITLLGRNQSVIRELIDDIVELGSAPSDYVRLFTSSFGSWESTGVLRPRAIESVILPAGIAEGLLEHCRDFLSRSEWYHHVGIPWHHGFLFWGPPGTGKSSTVAALAGALGMDLYLLSLTGSMNDEQLQALMSRARPATMILIEDVDCAAPTRAGTAEESHVTLGGLLNCLDGVQSREGTIIFMTTNFPEKLDPALTRPGRVDVSVEFGLATDDQILRLRDRLCPTVADEELFEACRGKTMADTQKFLLDRTR